MTYVVYYTVMGMYLIDTFTEEEFHEMFSNGAIAPSESWMLV